MEMEKTVAKLKEVYMNSFRYVLFQERFILSLHPFQSPIPNITFREKISESFINVQMSELFLFWKGHIQANVGLRSMICTLNGN